MTVLTLYTSYQVANSETVLISIILHSLEHVDFQILEAHLKMRRLRSACQSAEACLLTEA